MNDNKPPRPAEVRAPGLISVDGRNVNGVFTYDLDPSEILTAVHVGGNRIDVIFKTVDEGPDGLPVHGIEVGETEVESLLAAFHWMRDWQDYDAIDFLLERPRANVAE
ncbi:MAG: hypothetical protein HN540_03065 [Rhodospirillaceae bacterium]|jgi:hypothetical protein|nr:hypothetical protein [Rhodospirillaceae bacterium]MBT5240787.1 hypothetical protein [Rhodospirillaceae bacterium]MBT6961277.1 hypothetical protein [Rhodospirillaceae bacterium]